MRHNLLPLGKRLWRHSHVLAVAGVAALGAAQLASRDHAAPSAPSAALGGYTTALLTRQVADTLTWTASTSDLAEVNHVYVTKWVERFTTTLKADLEHSLARMNPYAEMISQKLAERDMPKELVYLALIESSGDPKARSPVKARGLWQFMSATARQYGLKVGGGKDERIDPVKSTDAALAYLSDLHEELGSWYLAAAAYNSGQGTVRKALKRVTGRTKGTDADFFRIASILPKETRDYVPKLVAAAKVADAGAEYGIEARSLTE